MKIEEAVQQRADLDMTKYQRILPTDSTPPVPSENNLFPIRNPNQVTSLPNIPGSFPSVNNIVDYQLGGKAPQYRIPLPSTTNTSSGSTTTVVSSSTSSSSSTTTNNPPTASTASITTPVLVIGSTFQGTMLLAKSFYLYKVAVNAPTRLRLYSTAVARSADVSRTVSTPAGLGTVQGLVAEFNLDTTPVVWQTDPAVFGSNGDTPQSTSVYANITNIGSANQTINVTLTYVPLQS